MTWLNRYTRLLVVATLLLITAGGMVTSTNSGLSVPDWPTTYGYSMFTFPMSKWVGGILYEHGHRLIATTVGCLTIGLVIWLWLVEPRRWMRWFGVVALGMVVLQGVLGGLTVLFLLPDPISIAHAGLAQLFFCTTVAISLFTSAGWRAAAPALADDRKLQSIATVTTFLIYAQVLIGATMRHTQAGLAIPDFPLMFGHLIPPYWSWRIAINLAHRVMALIVVIHVLLVARRVQAHQNPALRRTSALLIALVFVQATLGAFVVWTGRQPIVNTAHVATGAIVLATSLVLTLRAYRPQFASPAVRAA